ncbi:MAG: SGNH/GDSL hydrolase family protein [Deltaproteobacteria bacterium]|nr:SGNH/GDSL hydrolase family protein [Deltaproteobacteria bacterium]
MISDKTRLNLLLLMVSLALGVFVCEVAVRFIRPASDIFPAHPAVDPILGHRLQPYQSGHDARGFRNESAEGCFPIICIGDSQIYGTGIPRRDAIPQQLSRLIKRPVYNMAMGGYGPVQYYQLWLDSRQMRPRTTIVAFFWGNDLLDANDLATRQEHWRWLLKEKGDEGQLADLPLCPRPYKRAAEIDAFHDPEIITTQLKESGGLIWKLHAALRLHSALYALSYEDLVKPLIQKILEKPQHLRVPGAFTTPMVDTIFIPGINLMALDLRDERVRTGLLITQKTIELMTAQARPKDELIFAFIPTKENVYYDFLKDNKIGLPVEYECAVHYERAVTRWLSRVITARGGRSLDLLPPLAQAAATGRALYHASSDAHTNVAGNRIIAGVLAHSVGGNFRP